MRAAVPGKRRLRGGAGAGERALVVAQPGVDAGEALLATATTGIFEPDGAGGQPDDGGRSCRRLRRRVRRCDGAVQRDLPDGVEEDDDDEERHRARAAATIADAAPAAPPPRASPPPPPTPSPPPPGLPAAPLPPYTLPPPPTLPPGVIDHSDPLYLSERHRRRLWLWALRVPLRLRQLLRAVAAEIRRGLRSRVFKGVN